MKRPKIFDQTKMPSDYERAMMGLALTKLAMPNPKDNLKEIDFLFRGILRIERETKKQFQDTLAKVKAENPDLEDLEAGKAVFKNKVFLSRLVTEERSKSVYFQCIILQIYKWMKSVTKMSHDAITQYAKKNYTYENWEKSLFQLGPLAKRTTWANAILVASHYVRHFEEWDYEVFEKGYSGLTPIRYKKQKFLKTLKTGRARRTVQTLLDSGVKERELFGILGIGPSAIMKAIDSTTKKDLRKNCEVWLDKVNKMTSEMVYNHFSPPPP